MDWLFVAAIGVALIGMLFVVALDRRQVDQSLQELARLHGFRCRVSFLSSQATGQYRTHPVHIETFIDGSGVRGLTTSLRITVRLTQPINFSYLDDPQAFKAGLLSSIGVRRRFEEAYPVKIDMDEKEVGVKKVGVGHSVDHLQLLLNLAIDIAQGAENYDLETAA